MFFCPRAWLWPAGTSWHTDINLSVRVNKPLQPRAGEEVKGRMRSSLSIPPAGNPEGHSRGSLEGLCRIEAHLHLSLRLETNSRSLFWFGFSSFHVSPCPVSTTRHLGSLPEIICLSTNPQLSSLSWLRRASPVTSTSQDSRSQMNLCRCFTLWCLEPTCLLRERMCQWYLPGP